MPDLIDIANAIGGTLIPGYALYLLTRSDRNTAEFKSLSADVSRALRHEQSTLTPNCAGLDDVAIGQLADKLSVIGRRDFRKRIAHYKHAKQAVDHDQIGQPFYRYPDAVAQAIDELLKFVAPH